MAITPESGIHAAPRRRAYRWPVHQPPGAAAHRDALLAWAAAPEGVEIQMRKGYVSLHSPRRKFAQVTRTTNTAVDVALRLDAAAGGRLEALKARTDDRFDRRVRLTSVDQVDEELLEVLARALDQNT
ncbi:DUF5655 domain-containing protein [Pseudarthrobacter cellobiosi]|uniref:DUF5655 domain-containing protein n=1 Tax=Pseudarthrobacter cellobiosi TaxID=2953654 RepID=UPI00208EE2B5|nr:MULTISPECIES: DUF5655 domain-containing protein [unclassified Pseudarthrobacter]MCO4275711.1 DUF5655 domain-containing protein [Pseudarthrobacter sp. HLT3-5]